METKSNLSGTENSSATAKKAWQNPELVVIQKSKINSGPSNLYESTPTYNKLS